MGQAETVEIILADGVRASLEDGSSRLKELGYSNIHHARSGTEAWAILKNHPADLIIASWDLPELNGLGLLKIIRADPLYTTLPFLMIVEEITKKQVVEAGQAGVTGMVIRPFSSEVLASRISGTLAFDSDVRRKESKNLLREGETLMQQGRYDEAIVQFQKVLEVNEFAEVYYNLGYIKTTQARYEEAIVAFRKATEINNDYAQAYRKMGDAYARLGRQQEAQQCFEKAAELFMEKDMDEAAEDVYMEAIKFNPQTVNVYNSLGILYRRRGKMYDSIKMYQKALRVNPKDENIHYNLARAFMLVSNFEEAARILRCALDLNPQFKEAADMLTSLEMGNSLR